MTGTDHFLSPTSSAHASRRARSSDAQIGATRRPRSVSTGYDGGLHCDLRVTDLERAIRWYTDVLAFSVVHHVPEAGWAELQTPVEQVRVA